MLKVRLSGDTLTFGEEHPFCVAFQRTLRIPDDGKTYPLPPGFGQFPLRRVQDFASRVPESWREHGGVFIPMYQREALWISFWGRGWKPAAVKVAVGMVNAVSGKPWSQALEPGQNDYLVCPPQPWLDGINAGPGMIRQFVAMPLGMGYTVEAQVTGEERFGGLQIIVYDPRPGRFPDEPPPQPPVDYDAFVMLGAAEEEAGAEMGLAAGGRMEQDLYADAHGIDVWDPDNYGRVYVHIVNSMAYREITGEEPPQTPITARMYADSGFPWFDYLDEKQTPLPAAAPLQQVRSVREIDQEKGFKPQQDDGSVNVPSEKVITLPKPDPNAVRDGKW